jgi:ferritin-like metal-binding protein YciE
MATVETLDQLLEAELKDLYDAEKQLTKALPKLAKKARSSELKNALQEHLQQTESHVERLEQVFDLLDRPARGKKCKGMQNLISEGEEMIKEAEDEDTRDAVIIASAQKTEHYEMAGYGTVRTWATRLGRQDVAELLQATLDEEKEADEKLTGIAESSVNAAAAGEEGEEASRQGRGMRAVGGRATRAAAADRARAGRTTGTRARRR